MGTEESEDESSFFSSAHSCLLEWMTKQTRPSEAVTTTQVILSPVRIKTVVRTQQVSVQYICFTITSNFVHKVVVAPCGLTELMYVSQVLTASIIKTTDQSD
jgi:hypothetical protein